MRERLVILFLLLSCALFARNGDSLIVPGERYFKVNYDNDFFSGVDRYYSQGIRVELSLPFLRRSPLSHLLFRLNKGSKNYYGIALQQDVFTPRSIRYDSIRHGERPYTAVFFVSSFLVSTDPEKHQRLFSQLDLGFMGPEALGEQEQKGIHKALGNIQPLGWENQLATDAVVNYTLNYEKGIFMRKNIEFTGSMEARAGTLYDDIGLGARIRVGWMQPYFQNLGLSKTHVSDKKFQCYLFAYGRLKAVGYNATLQGGLINQTSPYVLNSRELSRVVGMATVGVVVAYKRISLEYAKSYISPEFNIGISHGWGHCNLSICF